jgi:probable rRNA maturation factor
MRLFLTVQYATGSRAGLPHRRSLERWARAALSAARDWPPQRALALTVRIVGARESAALNRRYRGRGYATNVLSFPFDPPPGLGRADYLGDVVICADVVEREAQHQGKCRQAHWAHMLVHGIMHLLGYDHASRRQAARMEGMETRILARLGFPDPYAEAPSA